MIGHPHLAVRELVDGSAEVYCSACGQILATLTIPACTEPERPLI